MNIKCTEEYSWKVCEPEDLWIFDKLILSKKLGYNCAPKGIPVSKSGNYIIRPCVNLMGMGEGAYTEYLESSTDHLNTGTFWCELFDGDHFSVDFYKGNVVLCVKGTKDSADFTKFTKWEKCHKDFKIPEQLEHIVKKYDYVNIEFIGNKVIELHLRHNPDFSWHLSDVIIPVWEGESEFKEGWEFTENVDGKRVGFFIKE